MVLVDAMGSTEGGMGASVTSREATSETAKFVLNEGVKVFTEDGREVQPGSGEMGMLATSGSVPVGYYKDPEKSAATFREIDGVRYSFPGDFATVEADGSITLFGTRQRVHQHGGREGVSGRSGGGHQAPSRHRGQPGGRRARRPLRRAGGGGGVLR